MRGLDNKDLFISEDLGEEGRDRLDFSFAPLRSWARPIASLILSNEGDGQDALYQMELLQIFSLILWLAFSFFHKTEDLNFNKVQLTHYFSHGVYFWCCI